MAVGIKGKRAAALSAEHLSALREDAVCVTVAVIRSVDDGEKIKK